MEILKTGFEVTVIGMGVVFLVLIFLAIVLKFFEIIFYKKQKEETGVPETGINQISAGKTEEDLREAADEGEQRITAIICAAMAVFLDKDEYICNIRKL